MIPTIVALSLLLGCPKAPPAPLERSFTILGVNDTYRVEGIAELGVGGLARVRTLRSELEAGGPVLVLHGGDFLYPSLLSREFRGAHMIDALNRLDGGTGTFDDHLFVVPGNHELERFRAEDAGDLIARLAESEFTWLAANVAWTPESGIAAPNLLPRTIVDVGGVRVGVVGVTVARDAGYVAAVLDPQETLRTEIAALRSEGAEVVVALTHLDARVDRAILEALPGEAGPDVIIGGHDHSAMAIDVGGRFVLKADADAVTATVARVRVGSDVIVESSLVRLGPEAPAPDPALAASAREWADRFATKFCGDQGPACLDAPIGRAAVPLVAEEVRIRKYETNVGSWLADLALASVPDAQVAFLNAGGIRLNRDLPAGVITRRHVEELLPYPTGLVVIDLPFRVLRDEVLPHAVAAWDGSGRFLQVAGVRFSFDPDTGAVRDVTVGGSVPADDAVVRAVTVDFLVDPANGQDGYTMLGPDQVGAQGPALKDLVLAALAATPDGVAPATDGRICNTREMSCP